ncbi:MAG: class I SAM-dependent methyltransferase [Nitrospirae bacterium]|nr:class I SAM-dependent methyltransferase [Nitrospirota bacterium]
MRPKPSAGFYDTLFQENRDQAWNDAPGKRVILSALPDFILDVGEGALDIGCGTGYFIHEAGRVLSPDGLRHGPLHGIDVSRSAIEKARARYSDIHFSVMDAHALGFRARSLGLIFSYGVLEHLSHPAEALAEIARVLRPGGRFFLLLPSLGAYRHDRLDEGWYTDLDPNGQPQWNLFRRTWEDMFEKSALRLYPSDWSRRHGALNPEVFFWGERRGGGGP